MKTTLKKTMAALSAAAVVAASAAVMAVPASAADLTGTISCATVQVTLAELEASNYQVKVPMTMLNNSGFSQLGYGVTFDDGLKIVGKPSNDCDAAVFGPVSNGQFTWIGLTSDVPMSGAICTLTVDVTKSAAEGDVYPIKVQFAKANGDLGTLANAAGDTGTASSVSTVDGAVEIVAAATEAPTTQAPTVPTATPVAGTTTAVATTTKKAAASTSSPKTGDALPIAGVAVAVAVIGGVALVSKKRK